MFGLSVAGGIFLTWLNDEVNLALRDPQVAARLLVDYEQDIVDSDEITLDEWQRRPVWEKIVSPFVWILERQQ